MGIAFIAAIAMNLFSYWRSDNLVLSRSMTVLPPNLSGWCVSSALAPGCRCQDGSVADQRIRRIDNDVVRRVQARENFDLLAVVAEGAGEARGRAVCARQQGTGGRRCAEGDRRSAPQDRPGAGRARFSCRAARHLPSAERRAMIAPEAGLSVSRQCVLLGIARSSFHYRPRPECAEELEVLKQLDRIFTNHPVYGSRRLQVALLREGISIGRRRVRRLMKKLGLWAVRPKPNTSKRHPAHKVYPYPSARQDDRPAKPGVGR